MGQNNVAASYVYGSVALAGDCVYAPEAEARPSLRLVPGLHAPEFEPLGVTREEMPHSWVSQRGVLVALCLLVALLGTVWLTLCSQEARAYEASTSGVAVETVQVTPGQGLLDVAEEHPIAGLDATQTARWIFGRNELANSMLEAGQYLVVPR